MTDQLHKDHKAPNCGAHRPQHNGRTSCENTVTPQPGHEDSGAVVSHAISPAVSLANGRESTRTETKSSQSGNRSCSNSTKESLCYSCAYRGSLPYNAHSECKHPLALEPSNRMATPVFLMNGLRSPLMKRLNITGNEHGIHSGWFMWPIDFDPVWLDSCDGYKEST